MYVYHNTVLQPLPTGSGTFPLGCEGAFIAEGKSLYNTISRNNILTNYNMDSYTIRDNPENETNCGRNDFDFDLYTGRIKETCPDVVYESNGIALTSNDQIIFNPNEKYALTPGSPGFDAGILIANFNDGFIGSAPDMGAVESKIDTQATIHNNERNSKGFKLYPNFPNPFRSSTRLVFYLEEEADVQLSIFDARGRRVVDLIDRRLNQYYSSADWDGRSSKKHLCPSGVYIARLTVDGQIKSKKLLLLR
jgi:hypothetical protein